VTKSRIDEGIDVLMRPEDWVDVIDPYATNDYYGDLVGITGNVMDSYFQNDASQNLIPQTTTNVTSAPIGTKIKTESIIENRRRTSSGRGRRKRTGGRGRGRGNTKRARGNRRRNGSRGSYRVKEEDPALARPTWTPFNTDITEWMRDIVSLNRLNAKRRKMRHVCDFLAIAGSVQSETLRRKKGELSDVLRSLKHTSSIFDNCFKQLKSMRDHEPNSILEQLLDVLTKQQEHINELERSTTDFAVYAKSVENAHNLQESFILNLKSHSLELDKKVRESVMRFLTHVPSHRYTDEDHESRVLATSMFQLKEWTAGRYGRPPIGITTKKTAHVTKFANILNMDIPDAHIPCHPDV